MTARLTDAEKREALEHIAWLCAERSWDDHAGTLRTIAADYSPRMTEEPRENDGLAIDDSMLSTLLLACKRWKDGKIKSKRNAQAASLAGHIPALVAEVQRLRKLRGGEA